MLIVTSVFPEKTQNLGGGVFNTILQIRNAVGLAAGGVIAASVSERGGKLGSDRAVLKGYHAIFWACLAASLLVGGVRMAGLRKAGKVGLKVD